LSIIIIVAYPYPTIHTLSLPPSLSILGEIIWAHKWHHVHIQELIKNAQTFAQNERILLCHVSRKYKLWDNVLRLVREALSAAPALAAKTGVALAGFGRPEPATWLAELEEAEGGGGGVEGGGLERAMEGLLVGSPPQRAVVGLGGGGGGGGGREGVSPMRIGVAATVKLAAGQWLGADGVLEEELPEVKTREEANRMLRVLSEDLGLRPRAESFVKGPGEEEEGGEGGVGRSGGGRDRGMATSTTTTTEEEGVEEEVSLLF